MNKIEKRMSIKKFKYFKKANGITLIALVITIIVLLILAGVSIATLTGQNGILTRATDSKERTEIAEEKEKVELSAQAALIDNDGKEVLEEYLDPELENTFGEYKYSLEEGENGGEQGFIVTITDTGRRYFVSKNGKVEQMIPAPIVTHSISPEGQVDEGEKITITINAEATEGEITKITLPDGSSVENTTTTTYEVEENGEYTFVVEQSNGGKTTYTVEITNGKYVEKFSDIYTSTQQYTKNGLTAWIPEGFAVGTSDTIDTIENGLVITDTIDENNNSIGNEFVWIPADLNEMAQCSTAGGSCNLQLENDQIVCKTHNNNTKIVGKLYATNIGENFNGDTPNTTYTENSGLREPDIISYYDGNSAYLNIIKGILTNNTADYADMSTLKNTMQKDYNTMIKSIEKYGGFYIGRYEMSKSTSTNTAASVANVTPIVADSNNMWYGLYAYGKTYINTANSVESSMIWGSQYDAMMKWMQDNDVDVTSNIGDNRNTEITTGISETDIINNIYDLYGCHYEWTLEANDTLNRVVRGR